jgi:hypothetical protein
MAYAALSLVVLWQHFHASVLSFQLKQSAVKELVKIQSMGNLP